MRHTPARRRRVLVRATASRLRCAVVASNSACWTVSLALARASCVRVPACCRCSARELCQACARVRVAFRQRLYPCRTYAPWMQHAMSDPERPYCLGAVCMVLFSTCTGRSSAACSSARVAPSDMDSDTEVRRRSDCANTGASPRGGAADKHGAARCECAASLSALFAMPADAPVPADTRSYGTRTRLRALLATLM